MTEIWRNADLNHLVTSVRALQKNLRQECIKIVEETINEGRDVMISNVESSNRIDTGYMLGTISASEVQATGNIISGQFGWGINGNPVEDYYLYQEQGFQHWRSGKDIPPMHALLEAFITVREHFFAKVNAMVNR